MLVRPFQLLGPATASASTWASIQRNSSDEEGLGETERLGAGRAHRRKAGLGFGFGPAQKAELHSRCEFLLYPSGGRDSVGAPCICLACAGRAAAGLTGPSSGSYTFVEAMEAANRAFLAADGSARFDSIKHLEQSLLEATNAANEEALDEVVDYALSAMDEALDEDPAPSAAPCRGGACRGVWRLAPEAVSTQKSVRSLCVKESTNGAVAVEPGGRVVEEEEGLGGSHFTTLDETLVEAAYEENEQALDAAADLAFGALERSLASASDAAQDDRALLAKVALPGQVPVPHGASRSCPLLVSVRHARRPSQVGHCDREPFSYHEQDTSMDAVSTFHVRTNEGPAVGYSNVAGMVTELFKRHPVVVEAVAELFSRPAAATLAELFVRNEIAARSPLSWRLPAPEASEDIEDASGPVPDAATQGADNIQEGATQGADNIQEAATQEADNIQEAEVTLPQSPPHTPPSVTPPSTPPAAATVLHRRPDAAPVQPMTPGQARDAVFSETILGLTAAACHPWMIGKPVEVMKRPSHMPISGMDWGPMPDMLFGALYTCARDMGPRNAGDLISWALTDLKSVMSCAIEDLCSAVPCVSR